MTLIFFTFFSVLLLSVTNIIAADQLCPTWFQEKKGSCECGYDLEGAIRCDNCSKTVSIAVSYCMTYYNSSDELVIGYCQIANRRATQHFKSLNINRAYVTLPQNANNLSHNCRDLNTEGLFCGQCKPGYGWAINSLSPRCIKCKQHGHITILYVFLFIFLPLTTFFIIIIVFRPNFPSGQMLGYIIYCHLFFAHVQSNMGFYHSVLDSVEIYGKAALYCSFAISGIWWYFLSFFYFSEPKICLSPSINRLQIMFFIPSCWSL